MRADLRVAGSRECELPPGKPLLYPGGNPEHPGEKQYTKKSAVRGLRADANRVKVNEGRNRPNGVSARFVQPSPVRSTQVTRAPAKRGQRHHQQEDKTDRI